VSVNHPQEGEKKRKEKKNPPKKKPQKREKKGERELEYSRLLPV